MLHGVTWQLWCAGLEQGIEHQPGLVQPQVFHGCVQGFAHQGARAITAHHIAGLQGVMGLMHAVGHRQLNAVAPLFQVADLTRQAHLHRRKTRQALAQHGFQLGLVEIVIVGTPVGAMCRRASTNQQSVTLRVHKMHALQTWAGDGLHFRTQAGVLKNAHHLAVKVNGAWQRVNGCLSLQHHDRQAALPQQIGQARTGRAQANDGNIKHHAQAPCT